MWWVMQALQSSISGNLSSNYSFCRPEKELTRGGICNETMLLDSWSRIDRFIAMMCEEDMADAARSVEKPTQLACAAALRSRRLRSFWHHRRKYSCFMLYHASSSHPLLHRIFSPRVQHCIFGCDPWPRISITSNLRSNYSIPTVRHYCVLLSRGWNLVLDSIHM